MTEINPFPLPLSLPTLTDDLPPQASPTEALVWTIAQAADERKAGNLVILKVTEVSYLADYFVISTGFSRTQVKAIADNIEKQVEEHCHKLPLHTEGAGENLWILQDYGDVLVHTFMEEQRQFYNLEAFWAHGQVQTLEDLAITLGISPNPMP